jgi:hypothetical protein
LSGAAASSPSQLLGHGRAAGSNATVYDPLLKVTWAADANLAARMTFGVRGINRDGSMTYRTALIWVAAMNAYDHKRGYLGRHDWMLPATIPSDPKCGSHNKGKGFGYGCVGSAMGSLYYKTLALKEPDSAVPYFNEPAGPFSNFQPYLYWTKTPAATKSQGFSSFSFNTGWKGSNVALHNMYVLPMVPGDPFGTPGATGLRPSKDGKTLWDPKAHVTWLANADLASTMPFGVSGIAGDGSMQESTAIAWIEAMRDAAWLGQTNWQLPKGGTGCGGFDCTSGPLGQLYYRGLGLSKGRPAVATPNTELHGFHDVQPYLYWSCQAKAIPGPCKGAPAAGFAWSFSFGNGFQGTDLTGNELYAAVYHPGGS